MIFNILNFLDKIGLTAQKRAIHIQFANPSLNQQVFLQKIQGQHAINQGMTAELICLSTNAHIPLKQFIGCQAAIDQVTDTGTLFRTTGIITEAVQGQSDGSLTLYKLKLQDATALWHKRRNSRVFMNKNVLDIVQTLFKEWQQRSPLFASSLTLDLGGIKQDYDIRPFVMQANESDYDFITRLLRSEGINWLIDEAQLTVANSNSPIQAQKLRLIDDNSQYQALNRRTIRYHRSSATEQYDSMTSLIAERALQPTAVHIQRWQADALEQEDGAGSVQSKHQHSQQHDNASLGLEDAWHFTPAWMQDLNGEDGATASGNTQIEKLNQHLSHYHDAQAKQFIASTTVRDTQVGYWFKLNEHPEVDQHSGADQEFLITAKSYYNQNNLPKDLQQQVHQLITQSQWQDHQNTNPEERQANQLTLQRRNIKTVPEYHPLQHRPTAHPQRARVVGPEGEEIHVDEWGRIKVRFLFTRNDDHSHDGGAGSNNNDTDSAWVDVLTPWAGEGYGARFLPRIGEIVVIDFFDGNIDRPYVTGRLHEAQRSPSKFDNAGQLPDTKKLAGIKSKEYQGSGYNQLRFDDTTGQISAQLQSSHAASQLNLGKLSHPKVQAESEDRGEGFELRTDQWGAIRAGEGLLITTHAQAQAEGDHLEAQTAQQQLEGNQNNAKALNEVAKNQQTDELESVEQLKGFFEQIQQDIARFEQAMLLLSSPNGIGLSTSEDIHLSADGQLNQCAGDSINLTTQKNLITQASQKISLFAAQNGIKQVAGKGKVEIQAQGDGLDILAKAGIQIISTEDAIYITSPKEIVMKADSSELKLNGSGIFPTTGGKFEVKAGQHLLKSGAKVHTTLPMLPLINIPPKDIPELKSTYAHDQLKFLAEQFDGHTFASMSQPIFGYDVPHSLYDQLQQDIISGAVSAPPIEVTTGKVKGHYAAFDLKNGKILVAADLVLNAHHNETYNQMLYIALLEEYGHYIDWLIRMSGRYPLENSFYYHIVSGGDTLEKIAELYKTTADDIRALNTFESDELVLSDYIKVPCTLGQLEPDGYMDEGSKFAEYMANLDPELKKQKYSLELLAHVKDYGYVQELRYADVVSRRYTGMLKIERQSGREAADLYANFMQQMEDNDGEYEYFGAGKGTFKGQRERGTFRNGRYVLQEDNHSGVRESHGHESIILEALGKYRPQGELLPNDVIMEIYAGNWLRDHSQIVVPAVLNRKIDIRFNGKVTAVYPNRDFLARILAVLAYDHFFDDYFAHELLKDRDNLRVSLGRLQPMVDWLKAEVLAAQRFDNLPKDKQRRYKAIALSVYNPNAAMPIRLFTDLWDTRVGFGKEIVGVYRPQEHIDNPQMEKDERRPVGDSRYVDYKDFNPAPNQKSHRTNRELASPHYNLKNYIADDTPENARDSAFPTALEYLLEQLEISMSGDMRSRHALRALGNAFHVLEDFFAHTNFTEVALIKQGYQVDDHIQQPYADYRQIPIVSGTFGFWDTLASVGPKLGDLVDPLKNMEEYKGFMYGERRLEDFIITAIVEWVNITEISRIWNTYLSLRDQLAGLNEALYVDKAREIAQFLRTAKTLASIIRPIVSLVLEFIGSGLLKHSHGTIRLVQGWGRYGENPTHTQLGKDDHHNSLHMLAAKLAIKAVEDIGRRWIACRESPTAANKQAVKDTAKRYFVHPARTNWMDGDIRQWARANPQAIRAAR